MISNQILQSTLDGLKAIARVELCVIDVDGKTAATTADGLEEYLPQARAFVDSPADSQEVQGNQFFKIYDEQQLEYILIVGGAGENIYMIGKMAAFQIQNLLVAYKERFDKDNFIKNLLLDNLLLVDIYSRAKKLYIPVDAQRVVLIIECSAGREDNILEQMRPVFGNNNRDFITAVDENNVIIVKTLTENDEMKEIEHYTANLTEWLETEGYSESRISYGTIVQEIKEVSRSYKEAKMAMDVGKIFFDERRVIAYSELGIGRLIYQLPTQVCNMFVGEIFGEESLESIDDETLNIIRTFFENNLNLSETSRQLYVHRNTLVYRFEKLQKRFGLDIRTFEDALAFKLAMMVSDYITYSGNHGK